VLNKKGKKYCSKYVNQVRSCQRKKRR